MASQANDRRGSSVSQVSQSSAEGDDLFMTLVEAATKRLDQSLNSTKSAPTLESKATSTAPASVLAIDHRPSFAEHLYAILEDDSNSDVLAWMPDGRRFTITNHKQFTGERMYALFKIRHTSSWVRKLTRYGFTRSHDMATGNSDIFKHEHFVRGRTESLQKIVCVGVTPPKPLLVAPPKEIKSVIFSPTRLPTVASPLAAPSSLPSRLPMTMIRHSDPPLPVLPPRVASAPISHIHHHHHQMADDELQLYRLQLIEEKLARERQRLQWAETALLQRLARQEPARPAFFH